MNMYLNVHTQMLLKCMHKHTHLANTAQTLPIQACTYTCTYLYAHTCIYCTCNKPTLINTPTLYMYINVLLSFLCHRYFWLANHFRMVLICTIERVEREGEGREGKGRCCSFAHLQQPLLIFFIQLLVILLPSNVL